MFATILNYLLLVLVFCKIFAKLTAGRCYSHITLIDKTCLITGGVSGLGYQTALKLAARGCKVIIGDVVNGEDSVKRIKEETKNPNVSYIYLDIGDFGCVRRFCKDFLEREERLDILINNAGISGCDELRNPDGNMKIMAVNYFGHFLLTHLLISLIKKTENSRIVFTSSIMAFIHGIKDLEGLHKSKIKNPYQRTLQNYGSTKLCLLITSNLLSKKGFHANSVYPGFVDSRITWDSVYYYNQKMISWIAGAIVAISIFIFSKSAFEGADTILDAAISRKLDGKSGLFLVDCEQFIQPLIIKDSEFCKAIWEETEKIVGLKDEEKLE